MNILLISRSLYVRNTFINFFIPRGFGIFYEDHQEPFHEIVMDRVLKFKTNMLIIDISQENYNNVLGLVSFIRMHPIEDLRKIIIVFMGANINKQQFAVAVKQGVQGFLRSAYIDETNEAYLIKLYEKIYQTKPVRKYTKILLDTNNPEERIAIKFRSPIDSRIILGRIKTISFGGILIDLSGVQGIETIPTGTDIYHMQFRLNQKDIMIDGTVMVSKQDILAVKMLNLSNQEKDIVCQFIFTKNIERILYEDKPANQKTGNKKNTVKQDENKPEKKKVKIQEASEGKEKSDNKNTNGKFKPGKLVKVTDEKKKVL